MATINPHFMCPTDDDSELPSIERAPLLSDESANSILNTALDAEAQSDSTGASWIGMEATRAFYEDLITRGVLIIANQENWWDKAMPFNFFKTLTIEQAREHLDTFSVEEVRQLWENGAFGEGERLVGFKQYMVERISQGDRLE